MSTPDWRQADQISVRNVARKDIIAAFALWLGFHVSKYGGFDRSLGDAGADLSYAPPGRSVSWRFSRPYVSFEPLKLGNRQTTHRPVAQQRPDMLFDRAAINRKCR